MLESNMETHIFSYFFGMFPWFVWKLLGGDTPLHSATFLQQFLIWGNGQLAGLSQISSMVCSLIGTSPQEGVDIQLAHRISPRKVVKTHDFEKKTMEIGRWPWLDQVKSSVFSPSIFEATKTVDNFNQL